MPRNGSGVYSAPSLPGTWNPAQAGGSADPDNWNTLLADVVAAMTGSIASDGQTTITNDLPMSGHKHTGVGNAAARSSYAAAGQVQDSALIYAIDTGAADAYVITLAPAITSYSVGQVFRTLIAHANATTTPALVVSGLTSGTIEWPDGSALPVGTLKANGIYDIAVGAVSTGTPTFHLQTSTPIAAAVLTTRGDIVVRGASIPQRLAVGTNGQYLTSDGTDPVWATPPTPFAFPTGIPLPFAGTEGSVPAGWLICAGQAVSRATYAALFAVIGTAFGSGDGSTTFNVPDLRGRAPFGKDDMGGSAANRITNSGSGIVGTTLGATGGGQNVVLTTANMPTSVITSLITGTNNGVSTGDTNVIASGAAGGSATAVNKMPGTIIFNWIIST